MERALIPQLLSPIFVEAEKSFLKNEIITDAILMALHSIFGKVLTGAVELIEDNAITMLMVKDNSLKTDQFIYQVTGSSGLAYVIFHDINYCSCKFYEVRVLLSKSYPACKHYVAARLGYIWKKYRTYEINFNAYKDIIMNITIPHAEKEKESGYLL